MMGKLYLTNPKPRKSGIAILISNKVDFKIGIITRSKIRIS